MVAVTATQLLERLSDLLEMAKRKTQQDVDFGKVRAVSRDYHGSTIRTGRGTKGQGTAQDWAMRKGEGPWPYEPNKYPFEVIFAAWPAYFTPQGYYKAGPGQRKLSLLVKNQVAHAMDQLVDKSDIQISDAEHKAMNYSAEGWADKKQALTAAAVMEKAARYIEINYQFTAGGGIKAGQQAARRFRGYKEKIKALVKRFPYGKAYNFLSPQTLLGKVPQEERADVKKRVKKTIETSTPAKQAKAQKELKALIGATRFKKVMQTWEKINSGKLTKKAGYAIINKLMHGAK
jgi:hypothetical protein